MSVELPPQIRLRQAALSLITLVGGVSLAAIPAATISISSRIFTIQEQGAIAVAIMVATFAGQLTFAAVVESRLSSAATERRVTFPLWLAALSILTALVLAFNYQNAVLLCIALPVLLASLEVGRGVSVAERLDVREIWAAISVGVGALVGVLAGFANLDWALLPLVLGIVVATGIRSMPVEHRASRPEPRVMAWVVTDVAITGGVYPVLNAVILALLGPVQAVLFTSISTVSGLLAIPLNFLRLRLLKEHSRLDIVISAAAVLVALLAIGVAEALGVFGFLFGEAWTLSATALALTLACLWRAASLATTIPFAALRRMGEAKLLTLLRGAVAIVTAIAALLVLQLNELSLVFVVLLCGELLQAVVYEAARRRRSAVRPD
ncbi:hypothetical protein [Microterricola viridarii]|uniref:Membrane protein involved in the export of O-antigen and teichoic acid n=1 Tax=Microterricola viridarii TaxID=412690 RepID=A0A0Y0MTQ7_9MICO|nr:hypothetical protein [Microterricola viridarii]AMB57847.1 hypothetical protein AWU67_02060 [Microterricola viridarii]